MEVPKFRAADFLSVFAKKLPNIKERQNLKINYSAKESPQNLKQRLLNSGLSNYQSFAIFNKLKNNVVQSYYRYNKPYFRNNFSAFKNREQSLGIRTKSSSNSSFHNVSAQNIKIKPYESNYTAKVKTILKKNILSRYRNSPYIIKERYEQMNE